MNAHDHVFDPVAELKANVAVPFNRAKAMPKSVYTHPTSSQRGKLRTSSRGSGSRSAAPRRWQSPATT